MPTKHRRIAILRDEDVERALRRARPHIGEQAADAAVARELVLRGAEAVAGTHMDGDDADRWLHEQWGAQLPTRPGPLGSSLGDAPGLDDKHPYRASEILEELRREEG